MSLGGIVLGGLILEFAIWVADAFCEKKKIIPWIWARIYDSFWNGLVLAVFFHCCDQVCDKEPSKEGRAYFGSAVGISVHHSGEGMAAAQSPLSVTYFR